MKRISKIEKVSKEQYIKDFVDIFGDNYSEEVITTIYNNIKTPRRATKFSAGYDFYIPIDVELHPKETIKIPTGIRCSMSKRYVLMMYVRSSIGFKYETVLTNGTAIIDSDYYNAKNEGHIFIKLRNDGKKTLNLEAGDGVCQGVFVEYGITVDDITNEDRIGGIGSTNK